jgi:hypothetical protein
MSNATTVAADPIFYDASADLYMRFSHIYDGADHYGAFAVFMRVHNGRLADTCGLVDREPRDSAFAAHWTRKARQEMDDEYAVNYVALKQCEQEGLISGEYARACEVGAYCTRVEALWKRLGLGGSGGAAVEVSASRKKKIEALVCDV